MRLQFVRFGFGSVAKDCGRAGEVVWCGDRGNGAAELRDGDMRMPRPAASEEKETRASGWCLTTQDADRLLAYLTPLLENAMDALDRISDVGGLRVDFCCGPSVDLDQDAAGLRVRDVAGMLRMMLRDMTRAVRAAERLSDLPIGDWQGTLRLVGWWGDNASDVARSKASADWEAAGWAGRLYKILDSPDMHGHSQHLMVSHWLDAVAHNMKMRLRIVERAAERLALPDDVRKRFDVLVAEFNTRWEEGDYCTAWTRLDAADDLLKHATDKPGAG